ncbi:hypothetical protein SHVI106290_20395 [Shewanella violacea]|uniref:Uncharacterized protein n=2 Tax=Shewanella violacea TaxID=60217 RepID=D4ZCJ6_SHEVD|nr:hypothetical protein SVI_3770 [Shewanella violacea DSS12]
MFFIFLFSIPSQAVEINYNGMWTKYRVFKTLEGMTAEAKLSFTSSENLNLLTVLKLESRELKQLEKLPEKSGYILVVKRQSIAGNKLEVTSVATGAKLYTKEGSIWLVAQLNEKDRVKIHCLIGAIYIGALSQEDFVKLKMFNDDFRYYDECG